MRSFHRLFSHGLLLVTFAGSAAAQSTAPDRRKFWVTSWVNTGKSNLKTSQLLFTGGEMTVVLQGFKLHLSDDGKVLTLDAISGPEASR